MHEITYEEVIIEELYPLEPTSEPQEETGFFDIYPE